MIKITHAEQSLKTLFACVVNRILINKVIKFEIILNN